MSADDLEIEQDLHLRSLADRTKRAEDEAQKAILHLAECTDRHDKMLAITLVVSLIALTLAMIVGYMVYGIE